LGAGGFRGVDDELLGAAMGAKSFAFMQAVSAAMTDRVHNLTLSHAGGERNLRLGEDGKTVFGAGRLVAGF
jgi:hypothetical protein